MTTIETGFLCLMCAFGWIGKGKEDRAIFIFEAMVLRWL